MERLGLVALCLIVALAGAGLLVYGEHFTSRAYAETLGEQLAEECPTCDPRLIDWLKTSAASMRGDVGAMLDRLDRVDAILEAVSVRSTAQLETLLRPVEASGPPRVLFLGSSSSMPVSGPPLYRPQYCLETIVDDWAIVRRCPELATSGRSFSYANSD